MTTRFFLSVLLSTLFLLSSTASSIRADEAMKPKEGKKPAAAKSKDKDEKECKKKEQEAEAQAKEETKDSEKEAEEAKPAEAGSEDKKPEEGKPEEGASKEEAKPAKPEEPAKPATVAVKKERFSIEVNLDGVFAAKKGTEVAIDPKAWADFVVLTAVEHGAKVKKGDLLIACDPEKIDEALEAARRDFQIAELAFKQRTAEYEVVKKLTPMELADMKRAYKWEKDDEAYFWKTLLPFAKESIEMSFEYAKFNLEYTKEELRQLEKMYEADEITEETEEIILKRARESVKQAEFSFKRAKARYEREKAVLLPRELEERKEGVTRRDMAYQLAEKVFPMLVKQRELEMAKAKVAHEEAKEKLEELAADRKLMSIKAPCGGTVYYGECVRGKWASASTVAAKLKPNGKLAPKEVLLTIMGDAPFLVQADFSEKELRDVREGVKASVTPTAYPDMKLDAIVHQVMPLPSAGTSFHAELTVARHAEDGLLSPGLTCSVKLAAYEKEDALTLPPAAVKTDEKTDRPYVYVVKEGAEPVRREIKVGRKTEKAVEVLDGLEEGDQVLASPPNGDAEKKDAEAKAAEKKDDAKADAAKGEKSSPKNGKDGAKKNASKKS